MKNRLFGAILKHRRPEDALSIRRKGQFSVGMLLGGQDLGQEPHRLQAGRGLTEEALRPDLAAV